MKRLPFPLLALLLVLTLSGQAKDTAPPRYFNPASIELKTLLPDPPANDSATTKQELALILEKQKTRTPEEVARCRHEVKINVWVFDSVLGPVFAAKNLPVTAKLFEDIDANLLPVVISAKKYWDRPRPFLLDKNVHPAVELPKNASYPSGHSTLGNLDALVLAQLDPQQKDALLARGKLVGEDRIIAGVHYPSDVAAGETLAQDVFAKLMASPVFQADLAKAKVELQAALAKQ